MSAQVIEASLLELPLFLKLEGVVRFAGEGIAVLEILHCVKHSRIVDGIGVVVNEGFAVAR